MKLAQRTIEEKNNHFNRNKDGHRDCLHSHNENTEIIMFFLGLLVFLVGYVTSKFNFIYANVLFLITVLIAGYHIIFESITTTFKNLLDHKKFQPNVHFLMIFATLGAVIIQHYEEAAMLVIIFSSVHFLEEYIDGKSRKEITGLLDMKPSFARIIQDDGSTKIISANEIEVGDKIQVLNGEQIATDGLIMSGCALIDESLVNGESILKEKFEGDEVFGGTINTEGSFLMKVTKEVSETVFSKILRLVSESQKNLTKTATILQKLEPKYVTFVLFLFPVVLLVQFYVFDLGWNLSLYRGMVYLISVSPCSFAVSAIPTTLATISNLAKRGVLVKGGVYLSKFNELKIISFDKTGTLTKGEAEVTDYIFEEKVKNNILDIVVAMEKKSNHPIARAIVDKFDKTKIIDLEVENKIGVGVITNYNGKNYQIGKPNSFDNVKKEFKIKEQELTKEGKTVIFIAEEKRVIGLIALMDLPNEYAREAIDYFKKKNIHVAMITGDAKLTGKSIGRMLKIDEVVADVMPEDKGKIIQKQKEKYGQVGMVGDGINDAPALAIADVGIAMGSGTDVAIDIADLVLMKNDLSKLVYTHKLSKKMIKITYQNILFSILVVLTLVILNFLGKMSMSFGVILHEGSTLLVILNALRMLKVIE
ncbi:heavy metal translocating P-type ATPase [Gemella cuniculi]|uniref:heavy metal translocating P-type ATPase n=1 Tax=Gemella cuniculi TaxID=150240 RepID=UPI0004290EFB|nr:heavy metal translocating P-type ATPase [Gemella cuniculi]